MDALQSLDGILFGRANITKAEVYLRATPAAKLDEAEIRKMVFGTFGYGLRSFERVEGDWDEFR